MEKESKKVDNEKVITYENEKIELPRDIQKRMLEFFMQTSIPRKKASNINNHLSEIERIDDIK